jgi:hypothetical protein
VVKVEKVVVVNLINLVLILHQALEIGPDGAGDRYCYLASDVADVADVVDVVDVADVADVADAADVAAVVDAVDGPPGVGQNSFASFFLVVGQSESKCMMLQEH